MQIIFYEARKMMIHQKGLLFIILFYVISITSLIVTDKPFNPEIELYKDEYSYYMNKVCGKYTLRKADFLENEAKAISDAEISLQKLYDDYYDGKISDDVFNEQSTEFQLTLKNERGFEEIYNQYIYIRENKDNRYFLLTNGWNGLLANDNLDLFLTVIVLLLVTPVFCYEYDSKMDKLVLTSKRGEKNYTVYKFVYIFFIVTLLCIITFTLKYCFYDLKYGLDNGEYPLQSLSFFGAGTKNITLIGAFFAISALKLFGFLFLQHSYCLYLFLLRNMHLQCFLAQLLFYCLT